MNYRLRTLIRVWMPAFLVFALCLPLAADSLAEQIEAALASDPGLARGIAGVRVESLRDGRVLYEKNSDLVFVPASNMKLIVSAASLDLLEPDHKIPTSLYTTGTQAGGVLKGDLILIGQGDCTLSTSNLQEMAEKIKSMGIGTVEGNVVGDDSAFDGVRYGGGWSWDYLSYYYAAPISALSLHRNVVWVWVRPGEKMGDPAVISLDPDTSYMTVENRCTTVAKDGKQSIGVGRVRGQNVIRVTGQVALGYDPKGHEGTTTVEDPTLFTATVFLETLRKSGVEVKGEAVSGRKPGNAEFVMAHYSPPMSEMIRLLNKPSDNLIAESLLKHLGFKLNGRGSSSSGADAEMEFIKKIGGDAEGVKITDGSGLSRLNFVSPRNFIAVLKYMHGHKHSRIYIDSLPIMGVDGTLRSRMQDTAAQGNIKAKTGYVGRARSLSGYATTKSGEPLVFSMLMNNYTCETSVINEIQNKIALALVNLD